MGIFSGALPPETLAGGTKARLPQDRNLQGKIMI